MPKKNEAVIEALRLMDDDGLNANQAAKAVGLPHTTVYSAFARRKLRIFEAREAGLCEKCGAPVDARGKFVEMPKGRKKRS